MSDMRRYIHQIIIPEVGIEGQRKIAKSKILVVGAGALGCPVLQYLAGLGVGQIGVVDNDTVSKENLHRQVLYYEDEVGKSKAAVAKEKLARLNSDIVINAVTERLDAENAGRIIAHYDIIIDCSDNIETRYCIDQASKLFNKPFVYGGVRRYEGQVSVFNYKDGPSFFSIFPDKKLFEQELDCASAGIVGYVAGVIGCLQVNEALKIILGMEPCLSGFMLTADLQTMVMRKLKLL